MPISFSRGERGGARRLRGGRLTAFVALISCLGTQCCMALAVGIRSDRRQPLVNSQFAAGIEGWTRFGPGPSFQGQPAPDGRAAARVEQFPGALRSGLSQRFKVGPHGSTFRQVPQFGQLGQGLEAMVRVWVDPQAGVGEIRLGLKSYGSSGSRWLAQGSVSSADLPRGCWVNLRTRPSAGTQGRLQGDSRHVELSVEVEVPGRVWVDRAVCGARTKSSFPLRNPSFDQAGVLPAGWDALGAVRALGIESGAVPYYGNRLLLLQGASRVSQTLDLRSGLDAPAHGDQLEAGLWVQVRGDRPLPVSEDNSQWLELVLLGHSPQGGTDELARIRHHPVAGQIQRWIYLETDPLRSIGAHSLLEWRLTKNFPGELAVDFAQVGEEGAVDGNPPRLATAGYVAWYRSPLSDSSLAAPSDPRAIWGNWAWLDPPYGDPGNTSLSHNPDCATSATCLRTTGRRDGAVGVLDGSNYLPLVGTYDSRDRDVVALHVNQARAIGLHSFVFDWLGHALNQQTALPGESAPNAGALEALFDAAEADGGDFKLGLMLEPKVHMQGWVSGQPSFDDRKRGIASDLIWYLDRYAARRALWRREGRPVVFVFEPTICMPSGPCMQDADWQDIAAWVTAATGEVPEFVAGQPPAASSQSFAGALRWRLVGPPIMRFESYAHFLAGIEQAVGLAEVQDFAAAVDREATSWAALDPNRFSVAMAWPGFDDSGVAGWGAPNGLGSDGLPLAVRVGALPGVDFLAACGRAVQYSDADWLHLATWNDWNERTAMEAAYCAAYADAVRQGLPAPAAAEDEVFARLRGAQLLVRNWLGLGGQVDETQDALEHVTRGYLERSFQGSVVAYD